MVGQRRKFLNSKGLKALFQDLFRHNLKRIPGIAFLGKKVRGHSNFIVFGLTKIVMRKEVEENTLFLNTGIEFMRTIPSLYSMDVG